MPGCLLYNVSQVYLFVFVHVCMLYLGPNSHLARAGAPIAATESRTVALLATDIVGFTTLSADIGAEEVVAMLDA